MSPDPDMKVMASLPPAGDSARETESGESIAPKGEVNADNQRTKTPAERLGRSTRTSAASRRSASPRSCISRRAAKPCAARSRWRRW